MRLISIFGALFAVLGMAVTFPPEWAEYAPTVNVSAYGNKPIILDMAHNQIGTPAMAQYHTWDWQSQSLLYTNLVAWYDFTGTGSTYVGANAGSNAVDYSVSNSPATVFIGTSSGATWVASSGPTSAYYSFDGGDFMPIFPSLTTNSRFSISLWLIMTNVVNIKQYTGVLQVPVSDVGFCVTMTYVPTYAVYSFGWDTIFARSKIGSVYPTNKWEHLTITYNGISPASATNFEGYINGSKVTKTTSGAFSGLSARGYIGDNNGVTARSFLGFLDDFRIYNTELNATQVTNIFNATKASHPNPAW